MLSTPLLASITLSVALAQSPDLKPSVSPSAIPSVSPSSIPSAILNGIPSGMLNMDPSVHSNSTKDPYLKGLNYLKQGKIDSAYSELIQVELNHSHFLAALIELQKLHYKRQEWEKFFGYALYYRTKFLSIPRESRKNFRGRLLALEALALARHCLWTEAREVAQYGIELAKLFQSPELKELEETLTYLAVLQPFPKVHNATATPALPHPVFSLKNYWPIDPKMILSIKNPKVLRFKVKGKCTP